MLETKKSKTEPSNMQDTAIHESPAQNGAGRSKAETPAANPKGNLARRTFMKRLGLGGTALLPASTALATRTIARAAGLGGGLSAGDAAILRLLAAAAGMRRRFQARAQAR